MSNVAKWPSRLVAAALLAAVAIGAETAEPEALVPPLVGLDQPGSWRAGVAAADAQERMLQIVCIGTAAPGAKPVYSRMFATRADSGAFRDTRSSALVRITP